MCVVTGRRSPLLDACLASLQAQEAPPPFEVLVVSDDDANVAEIVSSRFSKAPVALIPRTNPGSARNVLIARAKGEWLLFLDDDVTVEPSLLRRFADLAAQHPEVDVLGGPNHTPRGSTAFEYVQGAVLASIVATGPVRRRYGPHPAGRADERFFTLCNLAIRRSVMIPFVDDLICAEENALLTELSREGVRMHYDPQLLAYHSRRPTIRGFASQMYKYGTGRGQLVRRAPTTLRPAHLAPMVILLYLIAAPFLWLVEPLLLVPGLVYVAAIIAAAGKVARGFHSVKVAPPAALLTVIVHVCYGAGVLRGLVLNRWLRRRRPPAAAPRWLHPEQDAETPVSSG